MAVITASELVDAIGLSGNFGDGDQVVAQRLRDVCHETITRYVNNDDLPDVMLNESIIRLAGWLNESPANSISRLRMGPDVEMHHAKSHNAALRHCGAMSLLSPYKRRRANPIK